MAFFQAKHIKAGVPAVSVLNASGLVAITGEYVTKTGGNASGDIIEMGQLPAGCVPVDLVVHTGALGASVTVDAGVITGEYGTLPTVERTMGSEFFTAAQVAATAVLLRATKSMAAIAKPDLAVATAGWGIKIGGATTSAGITIRATLYVASAPL